MLFADDIVHIDETKIGLNIKLEQWRCTLEYRGFRLRWCRIEYLKCGLSCVEENGEEVTMVGMTIPKAEKFRYLGLIIKKKTGIDEDINHCIRVG